MLEAHIARPFEYGRAADQRDEEVEPLRERADRIGGAEPQRRTLRALRLRDDRVAEDEHGRGSDIDRQNDLSPVHARTVAPLDRALRRTDKRFVKRTWPQRSSRPNERPLSARPKTRSNDRVRSVKLP